MLKFSHPSVLTFVLGAEKNRLIETVHFSTHNIYFCLEIRNLIFNTHEATKIGTELYTRSHVPCCTCSKNITTNAREGRRSDGMLSE